ncbi:alkylation response protein AidB-like acyl-CoA dehydrogenase [Actinocorallia herbida]|uniref:Alkylation response protein AidB-like acyl-CoA dehydrogenase n=1 Tax=Actinocorallia herbida TaxID=58109 RepID=A0A3N1CZI4_9ACTN|nr:acyl-CoA dehydrogenase family protein [Actinocorallia herbida]ROO86679.1 alkylation response protein AidB-like acyl-CoA dehydrogenase [Actinocorallia herbida]
MDFTFTDEQTMLRESVARYLAKNYAFEARQAIVRSDRPFSAEVWQALADFGLLALPFPEALDGLGGSVVDLVAVGELFGEHLVVEPYLSSILLAGRALAEVGDHPRAEHWLGRLMAGEALAAFAHEEGAGTADPSLVAVSCTKAGGGYRLDGEKRLVLGGANADVLVVTARVDGAPGSPDGLALLVVEPGAPGVRITPFKTLDGRSAAHLAFDGVEIPADDLLTADAHGAITRTLDGAVIALAAEAVGAMTALLRQTGEYAGSRRQFGVPIATFQTVAHRLADMKIAHTKARGTLLYTAALAEAGRATRRDVSVLKAQVGRLGRALAEAAVQTHGGIGMTDELAIGHYLKRLLAIDAMFGDSDYHYRVVGAGA